MGVKREKNKIRAVIFDFDGVLANTDIYHFIAWKKAIRKIGINMDPSVQNKLRGLTREDTLSKILEIFDVEISKEKFKEIADLKNVLYKQFIDEVTREDILPGIIPFLKWLKSNNFKTAVASISKNSKQIIENVGLAKYFDVIVDPMTIKNSKPEPDIFIVAARKLDVKTWECVGIEDAQVGVDAINSLLMKSVCIDFHNELKNCTFKLTSTSELTPEKFKQFIFE